VNTTTSPSVNEISSCSGRLSQLRLRRGEGHPDVTEAQKALATAQVAARAANIMHGCPPLSDAQIERITAILRGEW
jgi:hypothetical protein